MKDETKIDLMIAIEIILAIAIICLVIFAVLNLPVKIISYAHGGDTFTTYGTSTVFDMLFNRNCPKIKNPATFNYITQKLNDAYGVSMIICDEEYIRWGNE